MDKRSKRTRKFNWTEEMIEKLIDLRFKKVRKLKEDGDELSAKNLWLDVPQGLGLAKQITPEEACRKWNQLLNKYKAIQLKLQSGTCSHEEKSWPYTDQICDIIEEQWTFDKPPQDSEFDILQMAWEENKAKYSKNLKSDVWVHFERLNRNFAQCKHCDKKLSFRTTISNLRKHLKVKHPPIYISMDYFEEVEAASENIEGSMHLDDNIADPDYQPEEESDILELACFEIGVGNNNRSYSAIWKSFVKIDDKYAQCKICKKTFYYFSSITNLKRHLNNKHPTAPEIRSPEEVEEACESLVESKKKRRDPKENSDTPSENDDTGLVQLASREENSKKGKKLRSHVWEHFDMIDERFARCKICEKKLSYHSTISNLRKHLRLQHNTLYANLAYPEDMKIKSKSIQEEMEDSDPQPEKENSGESTQVKEINMTNRRSNVWKYFTILDHFYAKCNVCTDTFSYKSTVSNLMKHRRKMHPTLETIYTSQNQKSKSNDDETSSDGEDPQPSFDVASDTNENVDDLPVDNKNKKKLTTKFTDALQAIKAKKKFGLKESYLWNFFTVMDATFAECNMCKEKLVYKNGLGTLANHQRSKHPLVKKSKTSQKGTSENETGTGAPSEGIYPAIQITDIHGAESLEEIKNKSRKYSFIWNFFTDQGNGIAECKLCKKTFSYKSSSSNLMKHRKLVHSDEPNFRIVEKNGKMVVENEYGKQVSGFRPKISKLWQFFKYLDEDFALCKMCNKKLSHRYTTANLMKHKNRVHPKVPLDYFVPSQPESNKLTTAASSEERPSLEQQESNDGYDDHNNDEGGPNSSSNENSDGEAQPRPIFLRRKYEKSPIWKLFDRIDNTFSKCKFCNRVLSHRSTNSNLVKHLTKHPDIYAKFMDMKDRMNTMINQFFPDSSDTVLTTANSVIPTVASASSSLPQQEIQIIIDDNQQSFDYNSSSAYTLPIIYIQDEQNPNNMKIIATGEMFNHTTSPNIADSNAQIPVTTVNINTAPTASLATNTNNKRVPNHLLNNNVDNSQVQTTSFNTPEKIVVVPTASEGAVPISTVSCNVNTSPVSSTFFNLNENTVEVPTTTLNGINNTLHVPPSVSQNTAQVYITSPNKSRITNSVFPTSINSEQLPTTIISINGNTIQIPTHLLCGDTSQVPSNIQSTTRNTAQSPNNIQNATGNTAQLPSNIQNATGNTVQLPNNIQNATGNTVQLPNNIQNATGNTAQLPNNIQNATGNTAQLPSNIQNATGNTARLPSNIQIATGNTAQLPNNIQDETGNTVQLPNNIQNATGNSAQVPAVSLNASGNSVAITNDYLMSRLEENNKLMQEMQRTINRQNDVLLRLAESISGRRERTQEEMLTD